jgi:hypothetical protein
MSQQKVYFTFKDGKIISVEPGPYQEIKPEPKKRVVMNRPGHVRPLHRRKR